MLVSLKFNNAYIFSQETRFSLKADMRNKRLSSNVIETSVDSVLKSVCVYGSNNSGKTCLVRIIRALWSVILSQPGDVTPNLFSNNSVVSISCVFIQDEKEWEYSFSLDNSFLRSKSYFPPILKVSVSESKSTSLTIIDLSPTFPSGEISLADKLK